MTDTRKIRILLVLLVLSCLTPFLFVHPSFSSPSAIWLYASALLGYAGLVLLLWMYALGTRSVAALFVDDQSRISRFHGVIGKYAIPLIFLHPLFVMLSYGESIFYVFVPHVGEQFQNHVTLGRIALYILIMVWFTSAIVRDKIRYRPWKYLHYLAYISLPFALLHVPDVGTTFSESVFAKMYIAGIALLLLVVSLLRIRSWLGIDTYRYVVKSNSSVDERTYLLRLAPENQHWAPEPGQYIYLRLGFLSESHPFSVVAYEKESRTITLAYRVQGRFTNFVTTVQPGKSISISRPYGVFTREVRETSRNIVFVAGGIGITPFLQRIAERGSSTGDWLFYVNVDEKSSLFLPQLTRAIHPDRFIRLHKNVDEDGSHQHVGYVSPEVFARHLVDPTVYEYFICGPPRMIKTAKASLRSLGVPTSSVHAEEFSL